MIAVRFPHPEYAYEAAQAESEQRAEYGSGCVSLGYDPAEWSAAYEGYRTADDPEYHAARILADLTLAAWAFSAIPTVPASQDDIPF